MLSNTNNFAISDPWNADLFINVSALLSRMLNKFKSFVKK